MRERLSFKSELFGMDCENTTVEWKMCLASRCAKSWFSVSRIHGLPCGEVTVQQAPGEGTTDMNASSLTEGNLCKATQAGVKAKEELVRCLSG